MPRHLPNFTHLPQELEHEHKLPPTIEIEEVLETLIDQDLIIFTKDQIQIQGKLKSAYGRFIELVPGSAGLVVKNEDNLVRQDGFNQLWVAISFINFFGVQP